MSLFRRLENNVEFFLDEIKEGMPPLEDDFVQVIPGTLRLHCVAGFTQVRENIFPPGQGKHFSSRSGKSQGIFIDSLPHRHSTYGYGSLLKIAVNKDCKDLIEHPILYREVFIYINITAYFLHIFYKIRVVSNLDRRLKGVCVPCLRSNIQE